MVHANIPWADREVPFQSDLKNINKHFPGKKRKAASVCFVVVAIMKCKRQATYGEKRFILVHSFGGSEGMAHTSAQFMRWSSLVHHLLTVVMVGTNMGGRDHIFMGQRAMDEPGLSR